jgi:hypothetical protein
LAVVGTPNFIGKRCGAGWHWPSKLHMGVIGGGIELKTALGRYAKSYGDEKTEEGASKMGIIVYHIVLVAVFFGLGTKLGKILASRIVSVMALLI